MKILFTCNALGVGGSERNVLLHARELAGLGQEVRIHPLVHGGEMEGLAKAWLRPELSGGGSAAEIEGRLEAHVRQWKPDVVHAIGCPAEFVTASVCSRIQGQRWVMAVQDRNLYDDRRRTALARWSARLADLIIPDGEGTREHAERALHFPTARMRTLIDGVDLTGLTSTRARDEVRRELGGNADGLLVGSIARLDLPKKGQDVLLDAISRLPASSARFVIVGDGHSGPELRAMADRLGVADRVTFAGTRSDLGDVMAALDVLVIPSRWESVPKVLLEAMALGRTVVTTSAGDITEVARDRENALVVPPGDARALAAALDAVVRDAGLRRELGHGAREYIDRNGLTLVASVRRLLGWYEEVIAAPDRAPVDGRIATLWNRAVVRRQLQHVLPYMQQSLAPPVVRRSA
jgi:glycosyltransferase involved in cell wall biosynthesis